MLEDEKILEETFFQNVLNQKYTREVCRKLEKPFQKQESQKWLVMEAMFDDDEKETE